MNHELWTMYHETRLTQPKRAALPSNEIPLYICRESSTNQLLFMQNKPNLQKSQMNANLYDTRDYERKCNWTLGENKPNSNPISERPVAEQILVLNSLRFGLYRISPPTAGFEWDPALLGSIIGTAVSSGFIELGSSTSSSLGFSSSSIKSESSLIRFFAFHSDIS